MANPSIKVKLDKSRALKMKKKQKRIKYQPANKISLKKKNPENPMKGRQCYLLASAQSLKWTQFFLRVPEKFCRMVQKRRETDIL